MFMLLLSRGKPVAVFCPYVLPCEQSGPRPAACEEVGLLSRGGAEGPGRARPVPQVLGVRVQLGEPAVSPAPQINEVGDVLFHYNSEWTINRQGQGRLSLTFFKLLNVQLFNVSDLVSELAVLSRGD